jgi:RNA polymerase sigma-70 factor (ECF subfamily)
LNGEAVAGRARCEGVRAIFHFSGAAAAPDLEWYAFAVDEADRQRFEEDVRALCARGDHANAATAIVRDYGPEILGFLMATHRDPVEANDTFAEVAEGVWRGLPGFAWESSVRTWAYAIARNVSRLRRRTAARHGRRVANASDTFFQGVVDKVRTETTPFLRTEKRTRLQALRDALSEEDRVLLVLRVDRGLAWNDVARIVAQGEDEARIDEGSIASEAARLRKRFQLVKDRLRELAKREGLTE